MTATAEMIARQLADLGFGVSVKLAYEWAFFASEADGPANMELARMHEAAAWDGDYHPREINASMELPGGYVVDGYGFDAASIDDIGFLGIRPDGTDVVLTLDQVVALAARYELAAA